MADNHRKPHAIIIPYPLQGHVNPSVHLAIKLASRGFAVTFINTQSVHHHTLKALYPKRDGGGDGETNGSNDIFANVRRSGLDIRYTTVSDGLPVGFDRSLNHDQFMASLLHVFSAHVEEAVGSIVARPGGRADCLIADTFFVWPSRVAEKFGLSYVSFWTEPALVFTLYYHLDLLRINGHFACHDCREDPIDYIPGVKALQPKDMTSYLQESDTSSVCHQIIFKAFQDVKAADFILCNTVRELETSTVLALQALKPFYSIGPVFPEGFTRSDVATSLWPESDCTRWLDTKPQGSVLYVSFGSYAHVSRPDLVEIAHGLSLSKVNFVWVLRADIVSSNDVDPLPEGFKQQLGDRAIIIPWCRQNAVLSHPAIGGFLTHCGWNSILESIWSGVPLLCFPLLTDQFTNRKLVADDWRIGLNLRDRNKITREEVANKITRLMSQESGSEFKSAVEALKKKLEEALMPNGSSMKDFDQFLVDIKERIHQKEHLSSGA
ncbi:Glycosyltransferase [Psidium guajava]|nr:Glycosyltransferase [Psidium guajava]